MNDLLKQPKEPRLTYQEKIAKLFNDIDLEAEDLETVKRVIEKETITRGQTYEYGLVLLKHHERLQRE